jgi:hypothetical protein
MTLVELVPRQPRNVTSNDDTSLDVIVVAASGEEALARRAAAGGVLAVAGEQPAAVPRAVTTRL